MKRVLIVDDAIDVCRMLQDAIKTVHPEIAVSLVPSAEEALLESTRLTIDLLVADIRLPGMSGLELIRKMRVRQPQVKVILMTGLTLDDRMNKQKDEIAPDLFFRKPVMVSTFLDALEQLIGDGAEVTKPEQTKPLAQKAVPVDNLDNVPQPIVLQNNAQKTAAQAAVLKELAAVMPGEPADPRPKVTAVRKGTGSLSTPTEPVSGDQGLAGVLSHLRGSLGAALAMLLDERGRPVAQAGDLPDLSVEGQLFPPVMMAVGAGAKISYLLGQSSTQSVQAYRGSAYDLVAAPVGQYVLLIVLQTGKSPLRLALAFEEALNAQVDLAGILEAMGLRIQSSVEMAAPEVMMAELDGDHEHPAEVIPPEILDTPLGQDPGLEKFEELFTRKKTGKLRLQDPDSFWDTASGERNDISQPGVLSFEQALKLGLLPPDQEK